MEIVSWIIHLVAGLIGGSAVGKASPQFDLGAAGNAIAGLIGGVAGGQILGAIVPTMSTGAMATTGFDIGTVIAQIVAGLVGGGVLTGIVGTIKKMMGGGQTA